jgi:hypothetical protein
MKHAIITRFKFDEDNFELMQHYVDVCKVILIPQLNKQTNKNFDWLVYTNPNHDDWIKEHLTGYTYTIIHDLNSDMSEYNMQTRHDIDDWMHDSYVQSLQESVEIYKYDKCLIHVNLILADYYTKQTMLYPVWHSKKTSQFLTMYQKDIDTKLHVYMDEHTKMWQYVPNVIELPIGLCMQVKHGKNKSS